MEDNTQRRLGAEAWRGILERFGSSGLTVEAFCRSESVNSKSFYRWRTRLEAGKGEHQARGGTLCRPGEPRQGRAGRTRAP